MEKLTFTLFSYNDALRIGYVVRNFLRYGEVVVFDDHSEDNTKETVENLGVKFIVRPKTAQRFIETEETFDFVKKHITTPWVYWGWTDNLLTKNLLEKMAELSEQTKYKRVYLPVYTYMWGNIKHPIMKARYPNFFMMDYVSFKGNYIHHFGSFLGKPEEELRLPYDRKAAIYHFSTYDLNRLIPALLRYTNDEAKHKYENRTREFSLRYTFGSMFNYFRLFFLNGGWRIGVIGLLNGLVFAFFRLMVAVRLYELEHNITAEGQEKEYAKGKEKLLREIENG
ncbi:MAG: hypothetical protein COU85_00370 [Candidatus Portnoybacteria bacterium CG10_big_fil_rev_8_21_14_0_10_44_7]|uniref:Glycosyltransferase 2-like domain-containing protein n=1 Tax=Candidatus Portnoybacteria bacterium CG10_big_fil_rev_8_21_14_0_10_44_7 TaxID=1974816 RepID=A0A2M8KJG8_9BACT|nr:MAG: hypothetical protein COU85_00370 [Candidatus Portnoybacteria bacterium CG10_big_fil_rev_8_21_14_0_10_44_7]